MKRVLWTLEPERFGIDSNSPLGSYVILGRSFLLWATISIIVKLGY